MTIREIVRPIYETSDGSLFIERDDARAYEGEQALRSCMASLRPEEIDPVHWAMVRDILKRDAANIRDALAYFVPEDEELEEPSEFSQEAENAMAQMQKRARRREARKILPEEDLLRTESH